MTERSYGLSHLYAFIRESNAIEGINEVPSDQEIEAYLALREVERPRVEDLENFVSIVQPGGILRSRQGMNVSVGDHTPPAGGMGIPLALDMLLADENLTPRELHHRYLHLHPFTDGNGRSARALWLHRRGWDYGCGSFLQEWYYDSLHHLDLKRDSITVSR